MSEQDTTHFGFRTVAKEDKAQMVRGVFNSVASSYDIMNDLMSAGVHRLWKNQMVDWLNPQPDWNVLDVGGGTGDIAFRIQDKIAKRGGASHITVCDINHEMLKVGRGRAIDAHRLEGLSWVCGNAETVPIPDQSLDAYTIAFCIRNVTDIPAALADAKRVLKPGGRFMCLEFSQVVMPVLDKIYDLYSFKLLPEIGAFVAKDRDSYQYLAESIRKFPPQETFAQMIRDAGFDQVKYRNLTGGIAAIHSAWRL